MIEPAGAGQPLPRAQLGIGATTLGRHQLGLALAAGCERVICCARALDPGLVALQHDCEAAGARFHIATHARSLASHVTAADEILVLADGLLAAPADIANLAAAGQGVYVMAVEVGLPLGFERVDINHAAAGAMVLPARLAERLNELPEDVDCASALLRIALQAGIPKRDLPPAMTAGGRWQLVRTEEDAHAAEQGWIERHTAGWGGSPGLFLASRGVRRFGPALLHAGSDSRAFSAAGLALLAMAAVAGWLSYHATALILFALGWLVHRSGSILDQIEREGTGRAARFLSAQVPFGLLTDFVLLALLCAAIGAAQPTPLPDRAFAPLMLIGLLHLVPVNLVGHLRPWLEDRLMLGFVLAGATAVGMLNYAVSGLAVALLAVAIGTAKGPLGITRA